MSWSASRLLCWTRLCCSRGMLTWRFLPRGIYPISRMRFWPVCCCSHSRSSMFPSLHDMNVSLRPVRQRCLDVTNCAAAGPSVICGSVIEGTRASFRSYLSLPGEQWVATRLEKGEVARAADVTAVGTARDWRASWYVLRSRDSNSLLVLASLDQAFCHSIVWTEAVQEPLCSPLAT